MNPQTSQQPKQGGPQPEPPPRLHGDSLYYLMPADEYEQAICQAWLEKNRENTIARSVSRLRVDRLTERHTVIVLMRRQKKPTAAVGVTLDEHKVKQLVHRNVEELASEVSEGEPITCEKHWRPASDGEDGILDTSTFLCELGKTSTPLAIKWRADDRIVWLGHA